MGSSSANSTSPASTSPGESVIVVMDANRGKVGLDALDWAIKYLVGPNDTVVALGVLPELCKRTNPACFPFHVSIGTSGIWVKLEFSGQGQEMTPSELEEEIERKKVEYQKILQPFYRQCKKREVKLDTKLAAGFEPKNIAVEEAQKIDPRWIVLDSCLKKDKEYIHGHVDCHVALMKAKGVATLIPSTVTGPECEQWQTVCRKIDDHALTVNDSARTKGEVVNNNDVPKYRKSCSLNQSPATPCSYPLSWRTGFPRVFSVDELREMTDGFANENILLVNDQQRKIYRGMFQEIPITVMCFPADDDQAVSLLKIVSRVRHRSILSLVGYCCIGDSMFLLCDYPSATLEVHLLCDKSAMNLSWKARRGIALDIGAGIHYLHEEFADGPIVNLSISSAFVVINSGSSAMLSIYQTKAKQLQHYAKENSPATCQNIDQDEHLSADIKGYGLLLLELISGKSKQSFEEEGRSIIEWALPLLEKNLLSQVLDPRLLPSNPQVTHMAQAALLCLNHDLGQRVTISKVLAVIRGDH